MPRILPLVPDAFTVPTEFVSDRCVLHVLTVHDVIRDYDAVMSSQPDLWQRFGANWDRPHPNLSLEQDLIDLACHQKEAQRRQAFTYAVMNRQESQQTGCVYIDQPLHSGYDAAVFCGGRTSELSSGLEDHLGQIIRQWLAPDWPFQHVEYIDKEV